MTRSSSDSRRTAFAGRLARRSFPETVADRFLILPNRREATVPTDLSPYQQVILEKQTLDVFDNPHTETVIERLKQFTDADAEFVVFGVVTEYCVRCAAKGLLGRGRRVALVQDAIRTLKAEDGESALAEMQAHGRQDDHDPRGHRLAGRERKQRKREMAT